MAKETSNKIELKNREEKIVSRREVAAEVQRRDCGDCWKAKLSEIIILITTKMKTEKIQISVVVAVDFVWRVYERYPIC